MFTIALVVKEVIILEGFSQIGIRSFFGLFSSGVAQGAHEDMRWVGRHGT